MKPLLIGAVALGWAGMAWGQAVAHFAIDATRDVHPISRLIYGVNLPIGDAWSGATFERFGGNRVTAYNWVTNASNAGNDWKFVSDDFFGGSEPGAPVAAVLKNAFEHDAGALITVPINGYVAGDENGPVDIHDPNRFATRFKREEAVKGSAFELRPDPKASVVYQDEFVNWVKRKYPYGQTDVNRPIYFELDNEADIWAETHAEVHPDKVTYAELVAKTIAYAKAIKRVEPGAMVYGPVNYGWGGILNLQSAPDNGGRDFEAFYLQQMARASAAAGKRLLDVLDIHWYPEVTIDGVRITKPDATPAVAAARVQAPRSLWDANYLETSWITHDSIHEPIRLIPRLEETIAKNFPGTKLSISEYNYGGGADISGAIAEADVLGIFGKYGVFSANEWPNGDREPAIAAGFEMFRNFDQKGGAFGDTSVWAETDDAGNTSVYGSVDSKNPGRMVIVGLNKADHPVMAELTFGDGKWSGVGEVYRLSGRGDRFRAVHVGSIRANEEKTGFRVEMPGLSVNTIVIEQR